MADAGRRLLRDRGSLRAGPGVCGITFMNQTIAARHIDADRDYSRLAADYDSIRFAHDAGRFLEQMDARIVRELVARTGARTVVDVPTGTGRVASYLAGSGVSVVGCDFTPAMLDVAKARKLPNQVAFHECDARSLPFADHSIECVVSLRFFHLFHRTERRPFVQEFERVLKPGGFVICSFTNGFYGGGINWLKKALLRKSVYFEHRNELASLFPGWRVVELRGNFFPWQRLLSYLGSERIVELSQQLTAKWPLNRVCWEKLYLLQAPDGR
jgi:ubiquinone/menaquinone biosynthesis C-methylase UbiE